MLTVNFKKTVYPWIICGFGALFFCYEYFLRISPSVMTSQLMSAHNLNGAEVGSLIAYYYHAYVPLQLVVGLLMDRFGPRRLITFACLLCVVGTILFADVSSLAKVGRFLVGFGSAFAFVGALKLATIWLPPNRFALVSGIILCLGMTGAMIGDNLLHSLVGMIGWRNTIYSSAVVGLFLSVLIWAVVRDSDPEHPNYAVHKMSFKQLFSGLWVTLKNPQIWINSFVGFLLYISVSAFAELWGIPYLEQARGLSQTFATQANSMIFLGWAVGGPAWGWFSDFTRKRCLPIVIGSVGAIIGVCILLYVPVLPKHSVYFILFGFGFFSSVQILVFAICHEASQIKIAGTAIALTNMVVMAGGNIFQPLIGKLLDMGWTGQMLHGARIYPAISFQLALSVIPVGLVLAIILTFFIKETHCSIKQMPNVKS
jgi:sugar phosphate permease